MSKQILVDALKKTGLSSADSANAVDVVVATIGVHPSTRLARRFLEQHVPADVLAEARAGAPEAEEVVVTGPPSLIDADNPAPGPVDAVGPS